MRVQMRSGESGGALLNGLVGQHFVLRALVLRELQSRFGRDNIGYLWVIVEPLMFASAITMIHYVSEQGPGSTPGMGAYPFTLLGYGVVSLLYHAQITPFDILLSRAIVDVIGALSALLILMTLGIMTGIADLPARPLFLYGAAFAIAALTFGLSLIIAAYTYSSHVLGRFVHPFSYFMFPLSGAFVTMDFLPPWAQGIMAWNPMMSIFEMARYGMFAGASDKHIYPAFMIATCAIVNYWGLIAIRRVRSEIHVG